MRRPNNHVGPAANNQFNFVPAQPAAAPRPAMADDAEPRRGGLGELGTGKIIKPWQWEDEVEKQLEEQEQQKKLAAEQQRLQMRAQAEQQAEQDRMDALLARLRQNQPGNVITHGPQHVIDLR
jgi:hypothetical protein